MNAKRRVAAFDFDGTLTREDTFISFSRFCLGDLRFCVGILMSLPYLIGWKLGLVSNSKAKERLYSTLYRGRRKADVMEKSRDFKPKMRSEIEGRLREHLRQGDMVYIVSASPDLWMEEMARRLGAKLISTRTAVDSYGRLTGRFEGKNCHGDEKLHCLLEEIGDRDKIHLTVYGDEPHKGDSALFEIADTKIEV